MSIDTDEVINERGKHYGTPGEFFEQLSGVWNGLLRKKFKQGQSLSKEECVALFICMKGLRAFNNSNHLDSWVDAAGYADIGHALSEIKQNKTKLRDQQLLKDAEEG
jgi:hypothetical protein